MSNPTYVVAPERIAAINSANDWADIANHQNNLTPDEVLLLIDDVLPGLYAIQCLPNSVHVKKVVLGLTPPPATPDYSDGNYYVGWPEVMQNSNLYHATPLNLLAVAFSMGGDGQTQVQNVATFCKAIASITTDQQAISIISGMGVQPSAAMAYVQRIRATAPKYFGGNAFDWNVASAVLVAYLQGFYSWTWQGSAPKINTGTDSHIIAITEPATLPNIPSSESVPRPELSQGKPKAKK